MIFFFQKQNVHLPISFLHCLTTNKIWMYINKVCFTKYEQLVGQQARYELLKMCLFIESLLNVNM